jgi:hypothetical protein
MVVGPCGAAAAAFFLSESGLGEALESPLETVWVRAPKADKASSRRPR